QIQQQRAATSLSTKGARGNASSRNIGPSASNQRSPAANGAPKKILNKPAPTTLQPVVHAARQQQPQPQAQQQQQPPQAQHQPPQQSQPQPQPRPVALTTISQPQTPITPQVSAHVGPPPSAMFP